jgi:short-subunit dehydrogenase
MQRIPRPYALITGASAGLGRAFALECARRGKPLILVALPEPRLHQLGRFIEQRFGVPVVVMEADLTQVSELNRLMDQLTDHYPVDWLINNAGMGGTAPFAKASFHYIDQIIQLNIRSTVILTRALLPPMLERGSGMILNVSSIAAFAPIAFKTVYPASKTFITSFTLSLREEFRDSGLFISALHPGTMLTNFSVSYRALSQGWMGRASTLPARIIARRALRAALRGQAVIVPGLLNRLQYYLARLLPTWLYLALSSAIIRRELSDPLASPTWARQENEAA